MVLVVDDNLETCQLLQRVLECQGITTQFATSADAAAKILQASTPAVVLLDYNMPDRSGLELLEEIREEKRLASMPVIIFSALSDDELIERAKALGADWMVKGWDWARLVRKITELHG